MQFENLENDPGATLQHLSKRGSLRLLCCTKGRRKGQHLLQLVFPEGSGACLKAPEAVPHLLLLRFFSMFTRHSDEFPAQGHSCVSSLCFFQALHPNPFFNNAKDSPNTTFLFLSSPLELASSKVVAKDAILESYTAEK